MKTLYKYFIVIGILCSNFFASAQSDGCSAATPISVTANCSSPTAGTTTGATQTIPGCVGNADDDVWYSFVATATSHQIDVDGSAGFDAVVQLFSGACSALVSLGCEDGTLDGDVETIYATGLTIGNTYRIRVYDYFAGSGSGNFTICVTAGPTAPSNDFCSNAIALSVNTSCSYTSATSLGATETMVGCAGTADDDVWFKFVATNSVQTITVDPSANMDPVVQLVDGACVTFTSLYCEDNGFTDGNEVIDAVGLTPGNTYYVRVYDYYTGTGGDAFDICVTGTATSAPTNDEPCSAIALPQVTAACHYLDFTSTGATASVGAPTPSSCVGGSAPQEGGFTGTSADVWFTITVPSTGVLEVMPDPASGLSDVVMALYSGTCGTLTQIGCSDDHSYPGGSPNTLKPNILETGLTPGATVYLRVWGYGSAQGDFGLCVTSPTNDECLNALYICDINGYSSSTSSAYSEDRPDNMHGNGETPVGVFLGNSNTVHSGGPFGYPDGSAAIYNVTIDNNSWIKFTASATTATLNVSIYDCWVGDGIQMQVFEGTNCTNFTSVSNFEENATGFIVTASGLTVGQDYYLMVDGFAGDICSYTITANTGVLFPEITAAPETICAGSSTTLTAPAGASSYEWFPGGSTDPFIVVSPSTTTTYTCIVEGVCDYKQTLTKTITVNQLPNMTSSASPADICSGDAVNLTLTSDQASDYSWVATSNANVGGESTSASSANPIDDVLINVTGSAQNVTYTVTPTSTPAGCVGPDQIVTVTVNPIPSALTLSSNSPVCEGDAINLTANTVVGGTYSWTGPNSFSSSLEDPTIASAVLASDGSYSATVTVAGCTSPSASTSVTVNPIPSALTLSSNSPVCEGDAINLTANTVAGGTYSWTGPNTFSSSAEDPTIASAVLASDGSYSATVTVAGCTSPSASTSVTVNAVPSALTLSSNSPVCEGDAINLTANTVAGGTYSWTGPNTFTSSSEDPTIASAVLASDGSYSATVTIAGCTSPSAPTSVTVNAIDDPSFTYPGGTYCLTGSDPIATISGLGGGTFSIDNGGTINASDGTIDLSLSGIGSYTITYLTNGPCPTSTTASITITNAPDATFNYSAASFCKTGTATVIYPASASGGVFSATPVGLSINPADGSVDLSSSLPNTYTVTNDIVAAGGCAAALETTVITIMDLPTVNASISSATICADVTSFTVNETGGDATSWTWSSDGSATITNNGDQNPIITGAVDGEIFTVIGTDGNSCSSNSTTSITIDPLPTVNATISSASICADVTSFTVNENGGDATSWTWSSNGSATITNNGDQNPTITGAADGEIFTVIGTDGNSCSNSSPVSITVNSLPTITATNSGDICADVPSFTLNEISGNATSWLWSSDGSATITVTGDQNPTVTGAIDGEIFTVVGTDINGCSNNSTSTITITALEDPSFNYSLATYCATGTDPAANVTGTTGGIFTISGAGVINSSDGTIDLAGSGVNSYDVTYTTQGTCPDNSTVTVNITTAPEAGFSYSGTQTYCQVGTETPIFDPNASAGVFTATPTGLSINSSTGEIDLVNSSPGTYTITNDIVAAGGCAAATANTSVTVTPPDNDGFVYSQSAYCSSDANPTPTTDVAGGTFSATVGLVFADAIGTIDITSTPIGTYDITYTTVGPCVNDSTVSVTISGQLDATITPIAGGSLCENDSPVILTAVDAGGTWSGTGVNATTGEFDPSIAGTGTHTITYTISGSCGDVGTLDIEVNLSPNVSVVGDTVCDGSTPTLVATGNGGVIDWYSDAALVTQVASGANSYSPVLSEGIYTYYAVETLNGCTGSIDSANANVFDLSASFTATPDSGGITLNVDFINTSSVVDVLTDQFNWDLGNETSSTDFEPSSIYEEPGTFTVILTVTNEENMCSDTAMVDIFVNGEFTLEIPNIFTPNGDKENDIFHVRSTNLKDVKATIFDRWGMTMYNWHGLYAGWDGRTKAGIEASEGTYYYFIEVTDYKGEVFQYHGPFNLNR